jgi:proteasome regulatory subunit
MNVADEVDFADLADLAADASGADIKAVCTEAGMYAIRDDRLEVTTEDFEGAWRKIQQADDDEAEISKTFA